MELFFQLIQVLFALFVVLGIFYLLVKLLKDKQIYNRVDQINVLERCYLSKDKSLQLVKVVDQIWLIAVTDNQIELLEEVELPADCDLKQEFTALNFFKKGKDVKDD